MGRDSGIRSTVLTFAAAAAVCVALLGNAAYGEGIGATVVVVNNVTGALRTGTGSTLRVGIDVLQDETIKTGVESATRVLFQDNTQLEMGEASEVTLDKFVFDPDPSKSKSAADNERPVTISRLLKKSFAPGPEDRVVAIVEG